MRQLGYLAALTLVAMLVFAPIATAQQMNNDQMMDNGRMMDDDMMVSPSASASTTPSATASTSASTSATTTASTSATTSTARDDHGSGSSSASAAVGGKLPGTGGIPLVSLGALALLLGSALVAARLLRRST
jgi:hypothetical protein